MKQTLTFLFASCLLMLMACYRNKKQPEDYLYKQGTSNHIYFQKEEGKTIYCTLKKGSSISFDCQDNGYTYVYSPDSNLTYSGKMPFIPADTSYIEFYGKRFYPRGRVAKRKTRMLISNADEHFLTMDSSGKWVEPCNCISDSNFWGRMITVPDNVPPIHFRTIAGNDTLFVINDTISNVIMDSNWINRYREKHPEAIRPKPSPTADTIPKPTYEYVYKTTIPINQLQPTLDTINMIVSELGTDMMVSRKNALTALMVRKVGVLLRGLVVDSVKVGGKK